MYSTGASPGQGVSSVLDGRGRGRAGGVYTSLIIESSLDTVHLDHLDIEEYSVLVFTELYYLTF